VLGGPFAGDRVGEGGGGRFGHRVPCGWNGAWRQAPSPQVRILTGRLFAHLGKDVVPGFNL